jgi:signal transduction histidine kinase
LLDDKIKQFNELILAKHITVTENVGAKKIFVSKYLIDILLNNLISNAIWHNKDYGKLIVMLDDGEMVFQNTGIPIALNQETIFERFKKGSKSEGTGLGLTLVENICKFYGWKISYDFKEDLHTFKVTF